MLIFEDFLVEDIEYLYAYFKQNPTSYGLISSLANIRYSNTTLFGPFCKQKSAAVFTWC